MLAPDLRGYGDSPCGDSVVTMGELADDVVKLASAVDAGELVVIGLSMGALVAIELARISPVVRALGLVAASCRPVTDIERRSRLELADLCERRGIEPAVDQMHALFDADYPSELKAEVAAMMSASDPRGAAAALRGRAMRPDYRPILNQLTIPTWVCAGAEDPWATPDITAEIVENLVDPREAVMAGVRHLPNLEDPGEFNRLLLDFLCNI